VNREIPRSIEICYSKKDSKVIISSYKPISIITSFSRIFEKLIYTRLYDHISTDTLTTKEQHGFISTTSTQTASYALLNENQKGMNNNCIVGGFFCDVEKAFGCVNHKILLEKSEIYEITGKFSTLIASYLSGRHQKVVLEDISSNWELNKRGVPQGSILGPLLFLLYINDIANVFPKITTILYADDTSKVKFPATGLSRPLGIQEVKAPGFSRFSAHEGGKVVTLTHQPPSPPGMILL
jgi:hypothetical protein